MSENRNTPEAFMHSNNDEVHGEDSSSRSEDTQLEDQASYEASQPNEVVAGLPWETEPEDCPTLKETGYHAWMPRIGGWMCASCKAQK